MNGGRRLFYAVPLLWLVMFLLVPFLLVLKISVAEAVQAQPAISFANYRFVLDDALYLLAYLESIEVAALSTVLCLLIGYPIAYAIARARGLLQLTLLLLVILPFWTSFLLRVYAWKVLLQGGGLINGALLALGLIEQPLDVLYTPTAVYIGIVYSYLPFMVLPLYAALARLDHSLVEAALDLGCRPWQAFVRVTLPLSLPGIVAGSLLVFIPAVGEFVIPEMLGGPDSVMIGRVLWNEFFANRDWPLAAAVAIAMLAILVLPVALLQSRAHAPQAAPVTARPAGRAHGATR